MTNQIKNDSPKPAYLQKYMGKERRSDKIQNTALLELNLDLTSVKNNLDGESNDKMATLLVMIKERLRQRLRDTDVILQVNHKFIVLLEEVEIMVHANAVVDELIKILSKPFEIQGTEKININISTSINLFSKFDLKLAGFPRHIKID